MSLIGAVFTPILLDPMINFLVILNNVLFGSFGLAIIAFTILIRLVTWPLTIRQLHSTRAMQAIQPKVQEIQKKYSDPKRRQQEMMALYKESGVNPVGCLGPMLLQMPILFALFYAVRFTLPESPEALERLSSHLYSWSYIQHAIPIQERFLTMDLREGNILMVVLVGLTTYIQMKTTVTPTQTEQQRAQQQMMAYMMPLMFGFFAISFPSGVSLYWVVNSIVGVAFNIAVYGLPRFNIQPLLGAKSPGSAPARMVEATAAAAPIEPARETRNANGIGRSKRQNRRRRN
ncbi:MAG: YidC/Oxa1 family membrane protein insertase [Dehalococcoidia bacterium]